MVVKELTGRSEHRILSIDKERIGNSRRSVLFIGEQKPIDQQVYDCFLYRAQNMYDAGAEVHTLILDASPQPDRLNHQYLLDAYGYLVGDETPPLARVRAAVTSNNGRIEDIKIRDFPENKDAGLILWFSYMSQKDKVSFSSQSTSNNSNTKETVFTWDDETLRHIFEELTPGYLSQVSIITEDEITRWKEHVRTNTLPEGCSSKKEFEAMIINKCAFTYRRIYRKRNRQRLLEHERHYVGR